MTVLSDDEALSEAGGVPQALRLHLSSCGSCHALSEKLLRVGDLLGQMALVTPAPALVAGVEAQLASALAVGGALTGRVEVSEEPPPTLPLTRPIRATWGYVGIAVAAMAALAVTTGVFMRSQVERSEYGTGAMGNPPGYYERFHDLEATVMDNPPLNLARPPEDADENDSQAEVNGLFDHLVAGKRCFHTSAYEAAACERFQSARQAMGLPFRSDPPSGPGERLDKPVHAVSTPQRPKRP